MTIQIINKLALQNIGRVIIAVNDASGPLRERILHNVTILEFQSKTYWLNIISLKNVIDSYNVATVFTTMKESNFIAIIAKRISKRKPRIIIREANIISMQLCYEKKWYQRIKNRIILSQYRYADDIVTLAVTMADDLRRFSKIGDAKLHVIGNPIDYQKLHQLSREYSDPEIISWLEQNITMVTLSRLWPEKNIGFVIRCLANLIKTGRKSFKLLIIGDGPEEIKLRELAIDIGVSDHVMFLGYQKNPFPYLISAEIFVLPSLFEGMSNSLLQAISLDRKCLVADSQVISCELVRDLPTSAIYRYDDIKDFEEKLLKLLPIKHQLNTRIGSDSLDKYLELLK